MEEKVDDLGFKIGNHLDQLGKLYLPPDHFRLYFRLLKKRLHSRLTGHVFEHTVRGNPVSWVRD